MGTPKGPEVQVPPLANPVHVLDLQQMGQVSQDCHQPKDRTKDIKATAATWVSRCTVNKARSMVLVLVDITNTAAKTIKQAVMVAMEGATVEAPTVAIAVDVALITDTDIVPVFLVVINRPCVCDVF